MARVAKPLQFLDGPASVYFEDDGIALSMVVAVITEPPTEITEQTVVVGTSVATLASLLSGGVIPTGATHAILSNLHASNTIYYTLDGSTTPVATAGSEVGTPLTSLDVAEVQNLANVKLIATAAGTRLNVKPRKY